jgi:transposase
MDAIFHLAHQRSAPWKDLPERFGNPGTVARFFRRLTHAGTWHRLLEALAKAAPGHPLRALEYAVCRVCRRAARLGGLGLMVLIRRLGLRSALPGPPWLLADPLLSETLRRVPFSLHYPPEILKSLLRLSRAALGRARIPRSVRLAWP